MLTYLADKRMQVLSAVNIKLLHVLWCHKFDVGLHCYTAASKIIPTMLAVTLLVATAFLHLSFCDATENRTDTSENVTCCEFLQPTCPTGFSCHENPETWGCRCVMPPVKQLQRMRQAEIVRAKYGRHHDHDHEHDKPRGPIVNLGGR